MATPKINRQQMLFQAECDADTMARYEEIMSDSKRRAAAVKAARSRADDLNKRAGMMSRVAQTGRQSKKK